MIWHVRFVDSCSSEVDYCIYMYNFHDVCRYTCCMYITHAAQLLWPLTAIHGDLLFGQINLHRFESPDPLVLNDLTMESEVQSWGFFKLIKRTRRERKDLLHWATVLCTPKQIEGICIPSCVIPFGTSPYPRKFYTYSSIRRLIINLAKWLILESYKSLILVVYWRMVESRKFQ